MMSRKGGRYTPWILSLAIAGIILRIVTVASLDSAQLCGSDFGVFYAGGMLVGTPDLYSAKAVQAIQAREMGCTTKSAIFLRLPFFAAALRPWTWLPFWPAFAIWRLATVAAIGAFIWLWPVPREWSLLACVWSMPLAFGLTNGQDSAFLLMWLALGVAWLRRHRKFAAGCILAMCIAKFHLFLLMPMLFEARLRKLIYGLAVGAALTLGPSFMVGGIHWPSAFLDAMRDPRIDHTPDMLLNARGLAHGSLAVQAVLAVLVLAGAVYVYWRGDFGYRLAFLLAGGLFLSYHNTTSDLALLIPVALTLGFHPRAKASKLVAIFLITPMAHFLSTLPQTVELARVGIFALLGLLVWELRPSTNPPRETSRLGSSPIDTFEFIS